MDMDGINAMNKRELVAELKKVGLSCGGNKSALKIRLHKHREKTVKSRNEEEEESNDDDDEHSSTENENDDAFERVSRLERDVQSKLDEIDALRRGIQNSTSNRAQAHARLHSGARTTNTSARSGYTSEPSEVRRGRGESCGGQ